MQSLDDTSQPALSWACCRECARASVLIDYTASINAREGAGGLQNTSVKRGTLAVSLACRNIFFKTNEIPLGCHQVFRLLLVCHLLTMSTTQSIINGVLFLRYICQRERAWLPRTSLPCWHCQHCIPSAVKSAFLLWSRSSGALPCAQMYSYFFSLPKS